MIVCLVNRKGGCGKTAATIASAGALAATGKRTLICDLDPQSSASQIFFSSKTVESLPKARTVAAVFDPKYDPTPEHVIHPTTIPNISIIPSSNDLTEHNLPLAQTPVNTTNLTAFLRHEVGTEYSHILIDCPPNLQYCSWAALLASDYVIIPVICESPSTQGLIYVHQAIKTAQTGGNRRLHLLGYLLTLYNRGIGIHQTYKSALIQEYGSLVFDNPMPLAVAFKESVAHHQPVEFFAPRSIAALAMRLIVAEMIARANTHTTGLNPTTTTPHPDATAPGARIRSSTWQVTADEDQQPVADPDTGVVSDEIEGRYTGT